jgi:hypothetical protein
MKHSGSCHCGKVKFEVEMKIESALECNCSICTKRGTLLGFAPEENFKLLSGEKSLTEYLFNKKVIHHFFCSTCGILPFAKAIAPNGQKMAAINLRCVDDLDLKAIPVHHHDGRSS